MTLLCPVRERFIQEFHVHGNATEALRVAKPHARKWKPEVVNSKASVMLSEGKVQERLRELQLRAQTRTEITVDKLTKMTMDAYDMAMTEEVHAPSAAVKAAEFIGKLHGLVVDRTRNEHTGKDGMPLVPVLNVSVGGNQSQSAPEAGDSARYKSN